MENNKVRDFCKPIVGGDRFVTYADLKKATKINLFEKFCLWFIKPTYEVNVNEGSTLVYKIFRGKTYILDHFITPQNVYKCAHIIYGYDLDIKKCDNLINEIKNN